MLSLLRSGMQTSIQDLGRFSYRKYGIPVSGAMDAFSAQQANQLLGNPPEASVLEFAYVGPELYFHEHAIVVFSGATFLPVCEHVKIPMNKSFSVSKNSRIKVGTAQKGVYGYMAIQGGFNTPEVLGSRSFYKNITEKSTLDKNDKLFFNPALQENITAAELKVTSLDLAETIEVYPGPEFDFMSAKMQSAFFTAKFTVNSQSNRMASLLDGDTGFSASEIITAAVQPGTVQLTPSGKIMVLMRDAQTTGGYARILQLSEKAISQLAQKRAGEVVRFKCLNK
jgi:biotin-dependent carboxylase-like uncharacterized protein